MRKKKTSNSSRRAAFYRNHRKRRPTAARSDEKIGESSLRKLGEARLLTITCYATTPSPNQWVFRDWKTYREIKDRWLKRIYAASIHHHGLGKFGKPIEQASLAIGRYGIRRLDGDNLHGGMKPVIDCIVHLGFLVNDTEDVIIKPNYFQEHVPTKAEQRTEIVLKEILRGRDR
jgi:hypothetical protein